MDIATPPVTITVKAISNHNINPKRKGRGNDTELKNHLSF